MQRKLDDFWEESKKVGLVIISLKTEEIRLDTTVNQDLRLNFTYINRLSEFCYLGSVVCEEGEDVNVRIQKARESFSTLRKLWLSALIRKDTKISIF
jgi:hypothetical protein